MLLSNRNTMLRMRFTIDFIGSNFDRIKNQSNFEAIFLSKEPVVIDFGDRGIEQRLWYSAVLQSATETSTDHEYITTVDYRFLASRHGVLHTFSNYSSGGSQISIRCLSNCQTDCIISVDLPAGLENLSFALNDYFYTFYNLNGNGGTLVLDGEKKKFTLNGQNILGNVIWTDFPFLLPGTNNLSDIQSVDYVDVSSLKFTIRYTETFV